jgi:hypothetical protein
MRHYNRIIHHIGFVFFGLLLVAAATAWSRETRMADIDGDGYKEAEVFYGPEGIVRTLVDSDHDGRRETVIYYKNGHRDNAVQDNDGDRRTDRWISYYFTGVAWKVAEDLNRDGKPDYWMYLKDGVIYKWEQDRNGDGKPDLQTTYESDGKTRVLIQQSADDDLDGVFEAYSGITNARREVALPHSPAEALLR